MRVAVGIGLLTLAATVGCRSSLDLCADGCASAGDTSQVDGSGMAGSAGSEAQGGSPSAAAGAGGDPAVCKTNDDCADELLCNGDEQCEDGACVRGSAPACEAGTTCLEGDVREPCGYAVQSPWLVLLGMERIWGLPTAELGKRKLLELGERPSSGIFVGMNGIAFAADGRRAFIDYLAEDFGEAVLELSFGRGLPDSVHNVDNLPNWGNYSKPVLSRDGARGLLSEFDTGAYFLDLSGTRAAITQLEVPVFDDYFVEYCSDNHTWLNKYPETTLYSGPLAHPTATSLGHVYDYNVELSPDARTIWIGSDRPRLVACAPDARSEALGVVADYAEFSPDSRFLLLTLPDDSTKVLSIAPSLTTTEVWSGSGVEHGYWSEGSESLVLQLESEGTSSYGYLALTEDQPALVPLALDGAASILGCGRDSCLARGPSQDDAQGPLLLQAIDGSAEPVAPWGDSATSEVVLADFERDRLLLQQTSAEGNELVLSDFTGSSGRHVFDWKSGAIFVERASDDSGLLLRVEDNIEFSNYWIVLPRSSEAEATVVPLDVPAHKAVFQPWP